MQLYDGDSSRLTAVDGKNFWPLHVAIVVDKNKNIASWVMKVW